MSANGQEQSGVAFILKLGAVAGSLISILTLIFLMRPELKPAVSGHTSPTTPTPAITPSPTVDPRKRATLEAWDEMQTIDSAFTGPSSEAYRRLADSYGQIGLGSVDPVLVTHISESIGFYREAMNLHIAYETEVRRIQEAGMSDWQKHHALQQLATRYQPYFNNIGQKLDGINTRDKTLARMLTEKYDVPFVDR